MGVPSLEVYTTDYNITNLTTNLKFVYQNNKKRTWK